MTVERPNGPVGLRPGSPEVRPSSFPISSGLHEVSGPVYAQNDKEDMPPPQKSAGITVLGSQPSLLDLLHQATTPVHTVVGSNSQDSTISSTSDISRVSQLSSQNSNGSMFSIPDTNNLITPPHGLESLAAVDGVKVVGSGSIQGGSSTEETTSAEGSPKSDGNPAYRKGPKRTASGAVKRSGVVGSIRAMPITSERRDLRATELRAQLQTRLSYALYKVDNGWERHSIEQLEALPLSRHTPIPRTPDTPKTSRRHSTSSDVYMSSPISQTSPSQISSRILQSHLYTPSAHASSEYHPSSSMASDAQNLHPGYHYHSLAPAPPITSSKRVNRRSLSSRIPPPLTSPSQASQSGRSMYRPPLTPTSGSSAVELRQQGLIRNQAEQDAVETLLFMSSPVNSGNMKYGGSAGSPLGPRRVQFENPPHRRGS